MSSYQPSMDVGVNGWTRGSYWIGFCFVHSPLGVLFLCSALPFFSTVRSSVRVGSWLVEANLLPDGGVDLFVVFVYMYYNYGITFVCLSNYGLGFF